MWKVRRNNVKQNGDSNDYGALQIKLTDEDTWSGLTNTDIKKGLGCFLTPKDIFIDIILIHTDDDRSVTKDIQKIIKYVNIKESNNISLPNKKRLISSFQFWHLLRKQGTLVVITMQFSRNKELWALHLR